MDVAVIRVTPKPCKIIKSLKKKIHVLNNIFKKKKKKKKKKIKNKKKKK